MKLKIFGKNKKLISISEQDIDYLIHSKGAMYTGVQFLLEKAGKNLDEINSYYIAGALGGKINAENAIKK